MSFHISRGDAPISNINILFPEDVIQNHNSCYFFFIRGEGYAVYVKAN